MHADSSYLAFDLGAASGRALLVRFAPERIDWQELHRFDNGPVAAGTALCWDAPRLFEELRAGLRACRGRRIAALGVDTWGVDFGLLDARGELLAPPRHYRDPRNEAAMTTVLERIPRGRIFASTGIQFMPLNTLYQLAATAAAGDALLERAERLLFMPDLLNHWLTGRAHSEATIASTSQAMKAGTHAWDLDLLEQVGVPTRIMPEIRATGTIAGPLREPLAAELAQLDVPVVLTAGHDTAAAVAAVPAQGDDWAYISSGTWSLVGVELAAPLLGDAALAANFTNEAGVAGTVRFLKNVAGLWLLQECRRRWSEVGSGFTFEQLAADAAQARPLHSLIDPDDPRFTPPGDMPARIAQACRELDQPVPADPGALARCILDSLALRYDQVLRTITELTGRAIRTVHVVGGGARNILLNRLIAAATGCRVVTGPVEATGLGNAAVQAIAVGQLPDVAAARRLIAASTQLRRFEPPTDESESRRWAEARQRFARLTARDEGTG